MQHVRGPFPSFFRLAAGLFTLAVCASVGMPGASAQTIYKWIDERGVVNYGNSEIPKSRDVSIVDTAPPVWVRPDSKSRESTSDLATPQRGNTPQLRQERARSREETARPRTNVAQVNSGNSSKSSSAYATWREACERQRRVDCNEATYTDETRAGPAHHAARVRQPVVVEPKPVTNNIRPTSLRLVENHNVAARSTGTRPITTMQ